jgi:hypothetical protein
MRAAFVRRDWTVACFRGDDDGGLFEPHPRWSEVPLHLRVEVRQSVQAHPGRWGRRSVAVNRDVDQRAEVSSPGSAARHLKRRLVTER